jgi:hypothetical protein
VGAILVEGLGLEVGITGHNFGRGPSKDYSTKVWLQLAQWFLRSRFLCEFPIGPYGKFTLKPSCLEPVAQLEPNLDGIVIEWSSSKIVSGSHALPPRWPPQCSWVVIESSFDPSYVKLSSAVQPFWSEGGTTRHNFGRGPSNDYFIKILLLLSNWFQTRRFLCEFPIGSYVKLSLAVGAILVTFKSSPLKPLNQIKPNLAGMVPGWVPFKIVSDSPALHSRWLLLLKIEISSKDN